MTLTEAWKGMKAKTGIRILIPAICFLCMITVIGLILRNKGFITTVYHRKDDPSYTVNAADAAEMGTVSISDMLQEAETQHLSEQSAIETNGDEETEEDAYATPHKESADPLTDAPVKLSDIYAASAADVRLKSYYPLAKSYAWEIYDMQKKDWEMLTCKNMTDELYRDVSYIEISASQNTNDAVMVRCTTELDNGEKIVDAASVYTVSDIIKIAADEYATDCGKWLTSREIPVKVTYRDGSTETIAGLEGLVFVEKIESSELSYTDTGNIVETVTTVNTECDYSYIGTERKEMSLRYRNGDKVCDTAMVVTGKDNLEPEITTVSLSDFAVNNSDEPVKVTVSIQAEDNDTPYPYLQYAFIPADRKLTEEDWVSKNTFEKDITQNGTWIAYCKDQSGNISALEKDIIAVDQKAPELTVRLLNDDWCKSNKIIAEAKDQLSVTYLFSCAETGEESGWTDRNEFEVAKNGTWKVQAKDAAGNISSKDVVISNIDTQMPVIRGITEIEGEDNHDVTQ